MDARGNVIDETLGNGLTTVRAFDAVTGLPDYIQSGPSGNATRQNLAFTWNKVGSLKSRFDGNRSLTEEFFYDDLHRFESSKLNTVQNLSLTYDAMGNITHKSDVAAGTWTYHPTKKHAVTAAGSFSFDYDDNGNQTERNNDDIEWTSYNYPSRIENGSKYHEYSYDGNRQRWKQVYYNGTTAEETTFIAGLLEKREEGTYYEYRHYIKANGRAVALYTRPKTGSPTTQYFLTDHQGSVAEITDNSGNIGFSESFGAYGQRRDATDWSGPISAGDEAAIGDISERGYTFHTNLESSSLVHMNGRVADGLTGRFLSPDPFVFEPGMTQGFNRYSYVNNNPITNVDPTGFCSERRLRRFLCSSAVYSLFRYSFGGSKKKTPKPPPQSCVNGWAGPLCYGLATKKTKIDSIFDKVHAMIYGEDGSILDVGSISSITTERFVLASATFAASAPGNGSVGCESHLPDVCEGDRVNEDYLDQLITHLRKRVVALNERIRDMTSAEQREAFGPYAPIIPIQIDVIDISLTGDAAVHTAIKLTQTGVEEVGKLVIPASGPAKWLLDKIGQLNPFKESYDLSDWDTICLDRNCGIIDPSNEYTPICEIASPAARHGKC